MSIVLSVQSVQSVQSVEKTGADSVVTPINQAAGQQALIFSAMAVRPLPRDWLKYGFKFNARESFISYQYKVLHTYKKGFKTNLRALGEEFEIDFDPDKLHEALYDLELNLKVWNRLKCMIEL